LTALAESAALAAVMAASASVWGIIKQKKRVQAGRHAAGSET
jgi:hypothetical protein